MLLTLLDELIKHLPDSALQLVECKALAISTERGNGRGEARLVEFGHLCTHVFQQHTMCCSAKEPKLMQAVVWFLPAKRMPRTCTPSSTLDSRLPELR